LHKSKIVNCLVQPRKEKLWELSAMGKDFGAALLKITSSACIQQIKQNE